MSITTVDLGSPVAYTPAVTRPTDTIREIHTQLHGHPGVRRVWAELVVRGLRVARKRVWRLMRAAGLHGRHLRAVKRT